MRAANTSADRRRITEEMGLLALLFVLAITITRFTPLPGGLIAMALFFLLLKTGAAKVRDLTSVTPFLLIHIGFFFIPPAVKVVEESAALHGVILKLVLILVISNILVMGVTGRVIQSILTKGGHHE